MASFDPGDYTIRPYRNSPFNLSLRLLEKLTGMPLLLTGMRLWMQVRETEGAAGYPLLSISTDATTGDRIAVTDAGRGQVSLILAQATLEALPKPLLGFDSGPARWVYDLRYGPAGAEERLFGGAFLLMTGTTR